MKKCDLFFRICFRKTIRKLNKQKPAQQIIWKLSFSLIWQSLTKNLTVFCNRYLTNLHVFAGNFFKNTLRKLSKQKRAEQLRAQQEDEVVYKVNMYFKRRIINWFCVKIINFFARIKMLKVAFCQKLLENFYFSESNIPNHYPEQKIWISCLLF